MQTSIKGKSSLFLAGIIVITSPEVLAGEGSLQP